MKSKRQWTAPEIAVLREHYPVMGNACVRHLPGRSSGAVTSQAGRLGLRYVGEEPDIQPDPSGLRICDIRRYADSITARCLDMDRNRELHVRREGNQFIPQSWPVGVPAAAGARKFRPRTPGHEIYQALYELAGGPSVEEVSAA